MCLWQKGQEAPLSGTRTHPAHSNAFYGDIDHRFRPFKLASNLKSSRGTFFVFLLRPSASITQRSQVAPRHVLLALRPLELRAGRDRALPCSPVRSPPATWGCRWWNRSGRERGFGVFFSFNSAVSVRAGCWVKRRSWRCFSALVIRHEPKPPALCPYMSVVYTADICTQVSPLMGEGPWAPLCASELRQLRVMSLLASSLSFPTWVQGKGVSGVIQSARATST